MPKNIPIKLHDGQAFSLTEFAYLYVKLGPMNLMTTTHAIYLLPCFSIAVPWMIPLQLPSPGLFSSTLHYSISTKHFFNLRLKGAEPSITNNFAHSSKQQIKQMTLASIFPVLYSSYTRLIWCRPSEVAQKLPAFRRLTDWYILMQIASKSMILRGRLNTEWKMN